MCGYVNIFTCMFVGKLYWGRPARIKINKVALWQFRLGKTKCAAAQ